MSTLARSRSDFQRLAVTRLAEAKALLELGMWDGAYYLAGYAVECGLKACVAKGVKAEEFPDKEFATKCYTRSIEALVALAELQEARKGANSRDEQLRAN